MSSRGKTVTKHIRQQRRKAAEERKAEYDKLSTQQKLDRLPAEGCTRQRARYTSLLNKKTAPTIDPSPETEIVEVVAIETEVSTKKSKKSNKK